MKPPKAPCPHITSVTVPNAAGALVDICARCGKPAGVELRAGAVTVPDTIEGLL
ncbi:hypothetical protein [Mycolicibacterium goodii]|uniref:Uncharacterized protein n=1 Tax=Mycobacterium phage Rem711 TaxID=2079285 RepID=A0A2K9VEY4_9CAUD|nr:hypothetical protein [Mycolicibacterium goodii]YP_009964067.1 hypothetical protein I5J35_gp42 [Mycobacterium phage Rem711]AUV60820.1 hypothetical protein SEA_REM711_42 [Mycobacterium phage Rem711]MBU8831492.1 hypothetical protein [Mycolicibacterium goodii]